MNQILGTKQYFWSNVFLLFRSFGHFSVLWIRSTGPACFLVKFNSKKMKLIATNLNMESSAKIKKFQNGFWICLVLEFPIFTDPNIYINHFIKYFKIKFVLVVKTVAPPPLFYFSYLWNKLEVCVSELFFETRQDETAGHFPNWQ